MEFRVLGPLEVSDRGAPVKLTARRQRALVCGAPAARAARRVPGRADRCGLGRGSARLRAEPAAALHLPDSPPAAGGAARRAAHPATPSSSEPGELDADEFELLLADGRRSEGGGQRAAGAVAARARARPLARRGARRSVRRAVRPRRGGPAGRAAAGVHRGAPGCGSGARAARGGRRRARAARSPSSRCASACAGS